MVVRFRNEQVDKHAVKAGKQVRRIEIDAALRGLADSMLKEGQMQPIGLLSDFSLIWGFRRHAASLLTDGMTHLWAVIFDQKIEEAEFLQLRAIENFQRLDLTAYEKFLTVEELRRHNPDWSNKQLADCLHVDPSMITCLLAPGRCVTAIREALQAGAIGISDCVAMSRVDEKAQHELLRAKFAGASRDQVHQQARQARNGNSTPAAKVSRLRCPLASGAVVQVSLAGEGGIEDAIEAVQEWLKEARRGVADGLDAKTFERVCRDKSKAGG